ncbi:MAG: 50S ribosomal protein L4 [Candidatus Omnitrophica bacterium CG1_02_46_14]|nr:MAG: 50S ribosomal protein L4 [Candidatus Omnitrophica bacterium CG1_02_46_14]
MDPLFQEGAVNTDVIYQAVLMYQAGQREGTASTLDRGHVSGGGKKPWKQKGTGQARHGSRRSPIWRHGGVTHGPLYRDYSYSIPLQMKRRAVTEGVKDKVANGKLILVKDLEISAPKTRLVAGLLDIFKLEKPLFLVDKKTDNLVLASRNIAGISIKTDLEVNALDVVSHKECVMTKAAYQGLLKRLKA